MMRMLRPFVDRVLARRRQQLVFLGESNRDAEINTMAVAYEHALRRALAECRINVIIDVGANVGQFARRLRRIGYERRIISIEPSVATFAELQRAMAGDREWRGLCLAAGAERSLAKLKVLSASVLNSLCTPDAEALASIGESGVPIDEQEIEVRPLDDLLDEIVRGIEAPRVFLKTDTQGFDHAVLGGAKKILSKALVLQFEAAVGKLYEESVDWMDMLEELFEAGWGPIGLFPAAHEMASGTVMEFDCLLRRKGAAT